MKMEEEGVKSQRKEEAEIRKAAYRRETERGGR